MTNKEAIQQSIAQAMKVIAGTRVDNSKRDKTVRASINRCIRDNVYDVIYNGGHITAYAEGGAVYMPNSSVYILVPRGDLSNKKTIVGLTTSSIERDDIVTVASTLSQYNVLSENLLGESVKEKNIILSTSQEQAGEFQDIKTLYEVSSENNEPDNYFNLSPRAVSMYADKATGILLSGEFKTSFMREQINISNLKGNYGLILTYRSKASENKYSTINEQWAALEPTTKLVIEDVLNSQSEYKRLNDYKLSTEFEKDSESDEAPTLSEVQEKIQGTKDELDAYILEVQKNLSEEALELCKLYSEHLYQLTTYELNNNGQTLTVEELKTLYNEWFNTPLSNTAIEAQTYRYDFDINQMVGDPYRFNTSWFYQYCIIPIKDIDLSSIEGLYFFCKDFEPASDSSLGKIKLRNPQLFFLSDLSDSDNDYQLNFTAPQGRIFYTYDSTDTLEIEAHLTYQKQQDFTSTSSFTWFKQDLSVTSSDAEYNSWAGPGWQQIPNDGEAGNSITLKASDNRAAENNYRCIGLRSGDTFVYGDFTIQNWLSRKNLKIVSDSGTSFDQTSQEKILTCLINEKSENFDDLYDDSHYRFSWSSSSALGTVTYNETIEDLNKKLNNENISSSEKAIIRGKVAATTGVSWIYNILRFPSSQISSNYPVTINCKVEMTEDNQNYFEIGTASIVLTEQEIATLRSYRIDITNASQVFQYNEAGVSPASERYEQPYEIKPLTCNFYSPSGVLVDPSQYTVAWQFPKENSLIVPTVELTDDYIYDNPTCIFTIAEDYSFDALENQITCIVSFDGVKYYQQTNFFFGKIGENGTNATDIVAKISPVNNTTSDVFKEEALMLYAYKALKAEGTDREWVYTWNTGVINTDASLKLELYRRNEYIDPSEYKSIKWSIAGANNHFKGSMKVEESILDNDPSVVAYVDYDAESEDKFTNFIIKGEAALEIQDAAGNTSEQKYYAYYPICVRIQHKDSIPYSVGVDKNISLRQVMYTADGRAPQYSKKQGIKLLFNNIPPEESTRTIRWSVCGGVEYIKGEDERVTAKEGQESPFLNIVDPETSELVKTCTTKYNSAEQIATQTEELEEQKQKIINDWETASQNWFLKYQSAPEDEKEEIKNQYQEELKEYLESLRANSEAIQERNKNTIDFIQIQPVDAYDGETSNHYVKIEIFKGSIKKTNLEYTIYVPIHLYLNQYGLSSVNGWDGNSVEVNEDEKYILAPQVGAGRKNVEDNTFTGLVMGVEKTYNQDNSPKTSVGLLGYNHGKQSIWLDAETGNATFGLPEDDAVDAGNPLTEGRVELRPGGTSRISRWRFDSRSLYRVVSKNQTDYLDGLVQNRIYTKNNPSDNLDNEELTIPYKKVLTHLKNAQGQYIYSYPAPEQAHGSIPHDQQGILLSAAPAYASFKGRPLDEDDGIDFNDANTDIAKGDTFEVEINPNTLSVFGIYNHMRKRNENGEIVLDEEGKPIWFRFLKAGIDGSGRFFSNALKDQTTTAIIGYLGGFGVSANNRPYIGASWDIDGAGTLVKMFTPVNGLNQTSPLYISSSTNISNNGDEGRRPLGIYGNNYANIYIGDNNNDPKPTSNITSLQLNNDDNTILLNTSTGSLESLNKAELKLTFKNNDEGHLIHARNWQTYINGKYKGVYKNTYDKTVDDKVTNIYKTDLETTVNQNVDLHIATTNDNSFNLNFDFFGKNQLLNLNQRQLSFTQKETLGNNNIILNPASSDSMIFKNTSNNRIKILQSNGDVNFGFDGTGLAATRMVSNNCRIILGTKGATGGIGLYAEGGETSDYVSFRMAPSGSESKFYLYAAGQQKKVILPQKDETTGVITFPEYNMATRGSYLRSEYDTVLSVAPKTTFGTQDTNPRTYPLSGVKIGPTLFTDNEWITGVLGIGSQRNEKWGTWADSTGLFVSNDIRTDQDLMVNENVYVGQFDNKDNAQIKLFHDGNATYNQKVTASAFKGDGQEITNTSDGEDVTSSVTLSISGGSISLSGSVLSVNRTDNNGRANFSIGTVSGSGDLTNYINSLIETKLENYVTKETYDNHKHDMGHFYMYHTGGQPYITVDGKTYNLQGWADGAQMTGTPDTKK